VVFRLLVRFDLDSSGIKADILGVHACFPEEMRSSLKPLSPCTAEATFPA
jgi:hypothetical protein